MAFSIAPLALLIQGRCHEWLNGKPPVRSHSIPQVPRRQSFTASPIAQFHPSSLRDWLATTISFHCNLELIWVTVQRQAEGMDNTDARGDDTDSSLALSAMEQLFRKELNCIHTKQWECGPYWLNLETEHKCCSDNKNCNDWLKQEQILTVPFGFHVKQNPSVNLYKLMHKVTRLH